MKKLTKLEKTLMGIAIGVGILLVVLVLAAVLSGMTSQPQDTLQTTPTEQTGSIDGTTESVENTQPETTGNADPTDSTEIEATEGTAPQVTEPEATSETQGGNTQGGNTQSGNTQSGNTQGGNNQGGNTQGGNNQGGNNQGGNTQGGDSEDNPVQPTETPTQPPVDVPVNSLSDPNLRLDAFGGYSGNFLEDGSDELVTNVAAIRVTNTSDQMLQVAQIVFQVAEGEVARFQITNLPAGETVLALELDRRLYSDADDYSYGRTATAYLEKPTLAEDQVKLDTSKNGELTLENISGQTLAEVYVYYKYVQQGGDYLGGITYVVPFKNVEAGATVTVTAGHFRPDNSQIVNVDIVTE